MARTNYSWAFDAGAHPAVVVVAAVALLLPLLLQLLVVADDGVVLGLDVAEVIDKYKQLQLKLKPVVVDSDPPYGDGAASFGVEVGIPQSPEAELVALGDGPVAVGERLVALVLPLVHHSLDVAVALAAVVATRPFVAAVAPTLINFILF